jgi:EAL domain-containing protein (putative c-di-GMP-specific phosphodiesterase class I)
MQPMDPATAAALAALVNDEQPVVSLIQPFGSERLDDFGTGYSSLSYLHSLPLDILNVAKPFVDGLTGGGRESRFVGMILDLARALGLEVIAEGIESAEQVDALRELRTEFGQGYHLARPSAAADTSLVTALAG